jgi:nitrite reductase/ring-hydroxylating ferredoxin subunit
VFQRVASLADIGPYDIVPVTIGDTEIVLYQVEGSIYASQRYCVHQGSDLTEGIVSSGFLVCAAHAWRFDAKTGVHEISRQTCLATFAVKVEGDDVLVDPTPIRNAEVPQ